MINNNVALVDRGGHESIIYLTGVAFKKKVGQHISDSEVAKTFVLDSQGSIRAF
ncbi:CAT RNA binding domain-containing protein [Staphylococcus aureus]|uniref:CAT RNA binding domain-containing protein n=1 Tax=Staphylococcus aureus TaxID=1280 RepID=UPI003D6D4A9B